MRTSVPRALVDELDRVLGNEPVLWGDTPHPYGYLRREVAGIVFGCLFLAFSMSIEISRLSSDPLGLLYFILFATVPLTLIGFVVHLLWKSRRVYYALTRTRALILERGRELRTREYDLARLPTLERIAHSRNRGDIVFEKVVSMSKRGPGRDVVTDVGFIGLRDYAGACAALERVLRRPF